MTFPLILGDVVFSTLEIPQKIGPLGGKQTVVVHEYPGGTREVDSIGAFPLTLTWSGIFTGPDAFARAATLDRMRATGLDVTMQYGPQAYVGVISRFEYNPSHQFFIPYTLIFEPSLDLSGVGSVVLDLNTDDQDLATETGGLSDVQDGADGLAMPDSLVAPSAALQDAVTIGLQNGDGTVEGISAADGQAIGLAAAAVQVAAAPLIAGSDPAQASPALDASARAAAIAVVVLLPTQSTRQFQAINPNLFAIAAQYFNGDTSRWLDIATASGLYDPQPIGEFTIVVPG